LVDGLHDYNNSIPFTLVKSEYIAKTIIEVFSIGFLEKGDDHCHLHIGFVIGIIFIWLIYSIESTAIITINLKIGYEFTMLSRRDGAIMRENRVKAPTFLLFHFRVTSTTFSYFSRTIL
jgi:hypothetical protein